MLSCIQGNIGPILFLPLLPPSSEDQAVFKHFCEHLSNIFHFKANEQIEDKAKKYEWCKRAKKTPIRQNLTL